MPSHTISLALLSLAGSALAFPRPSGLPSGFPAGGFPTAASASGSGIPYPLGNDTRIHLPTSGQPRHHRSSQGVKTQTATATLYNTVTAYSTIQVQAAGATDSAGAGNGSSDTCTTPTMTSTVTNKVYVTVTPGASSEEASPAISSASSSSSSSSVFLQLVSSAAPSSSVSVNAAAVSYSSWASSTAASSTPTTSAEASSVASSALVSSAASSSEAATSSASSTTSSAAASSSSSSSSGTKRGLAYNDISLLAAFDNTQTSWCWNWGQEAGGDTDGNMYIPTLWNASDVEGSIGYERTQTWVANAKSAISNGATALFSFNECDLEAQANMSPEDAATQYKTWLSDEFGGQGVTLVAPSVTNGAAPLGLDWMTNFLGNCSSCQIDAVNIHWYAPATSIDDFKQHVTDAHTLSGKSVYVSEFAPTGSDDEITSFLEEALTWLDSQDFVEKYSYFMVADGILNTGTSLSTIGEKYATFTS